MRSLALVLGLLACLACKGVDAQATKAVTRCTPPPYTGAEALIDDDTLPTQLTRIEEFWEQCVSKDSFKPVAGGRIELAYAMVRQPGESPAIVISSGRTEHYGKYKEVIYDFWRAGYSVYIHDHRGQGLSSRVLEAQADRQKGHVERFQDYVDDLHAFVGRFTPGHANRFLVGHSMGGGIGTLYLMQHLQVFDAAVFASPMHKPNTWPLTEAACTWSERPWFFWGSSWLFFKEQPYEDKLFTDKGQIYTRSQVRYDTWFRSKTAIPDQARIGGVTRQWLREACTASDAMLRDAPKVQTPLVVFQAREDKAVLPEAQDEFCRALQQGNQKCHPRGVPVPYENVGHELFIERSPVRSDVMLRTLDFFERTRRSNP